MPPDRTTPPNSVDDWLLSLIVCPVTGERLHHAPAELIEQLNQAVAAGTLRFRNGTQVSFPLDGGLVNDSNTFLFGIFEHVPNLIPDEAIELTRDALDHAGGQPPHEDAPSIGDNDPP